MNTKLSLIALAAACSPEQKPEIIDKPVDTIMSVWQPVQYARLREASPEQNFGGQPLYLGASADGVETALVQYNAEHFRGMDVEKAVLQFSAGQTCHSSYVLTFPKCGLDLVVEAHEIVLPWKQSTVTWNSFYGSAEPYNPTILGTARLRIPEGNHFQYTIDVTTAVRDWISGKPDYGIALIADEKGRRKGRFEQTDSVVDHPELAVHAK
ncbi:DNRLRE domain-containing protein [Candidatus Woesearchaeota archaeon]|nr:DNRLRE domain-containing protein [Candidatus Woesearchaeota archaeon]